MPDRAPKLWLVDDDEELLELVSHRLQTQTPTDTSLFNSGKEALKALQESGAPDILLVDLQLPEISGLELSRRVKERNPRLKTIVITGHQSTQSAIEAIRLGATDYLCKPLNFDQLNGTIRRLLQRLKTGAPTLQTSPSEKILGKSDALLHILGLVSKYAVSDACVLIQGESGTGKELIAREVHLQSARAKKPFLAVNCSAIPESLLESELFGHKKGAFTGASSNRDGLFVSANGGTLFLDEIGDMPIQLQCKLLRVLQEHCVRPVGGDRDIEVDVRIVCATHKDLIKLLEKGEFRQDLFFRLNVLPIRLPALRERKEDIDVIAVSILKNYAKDYNKDLKGFSEKAWDALRGYSWPGNIRELRNVIERAVVLSKGKEIVDSEIELLEQPETHQATVALPDGVPIKVIEELYISHILKKCNGVKEKAAKILGVDRKTIYRKQKSME